MKVGSLFTGIGGLDLGLERSGMEIVWQVEKDPYCNKVLAKHWPEVPRYGDIKEIDFSTLPPVDLICGGFPCQPVSCAGKRQGDKDERWLWPEFYRAICEARPRWVLVENVPGLLSASDGRLFGGILGELARCGYDAEWDLLPAAAFGAPHLRYRIFIVAHIYNPRSSALGKDGFKARSIKALGSRSKQKNGEVPNSELIRLEGNQSTGRKKTGVRRRPSIKNSPNRHSNGGNGDKREVCEVEERQDSKSPRVCPDVAHTYPERFPLIFGSAAHEGMDGGGTIGDSGWWTTEPDVGRVAHGIPSRVDRLKCLGNAVVPQVAEWIGRRIMEVERNG